MNKTPKHQNLVTKIQILAPFDLSFKQIKNQFSNFWNRADESEVQGEAAAPLVFKKKKKKWKYCFAAQNRTISTIFHVFSL